MNTCSADTEYDDDDLNDDGDHDDDLNDDDDDVFKTSPSVCCYPTTLPFVLLPWE